ncbi:MAG: preprotein translocase subunit SecG [Pseudomonadota bacterium]|jgi:preprotein translocase subunit SecG
MLHTILMLVLVFCAVCIIVLVLLQRGKGADAGAGFGAGASGTVFGARGASTALSRTTAILAGVFMVTCLLLSYVVTRGTRTTESALERIANEVQNTNGVPSVPAVPATAPESTPVPAPATAPATN